MHVRWQDLKVNALPVFVNPPRVFRREDWEKLEPLRKYVSEEWRPYVPLGPWRPKFGKDLEKFIEAKMDSLKSKLNDVELLEPLLYQTDEDLTKIEDRVTGHVDLILANWAGGWPGTYVFRLGQLGKPLMKIGLHDWAFRALDPIGALRYQGREAYFAYNFDVANSTLKLLKVKKALRMSKIIHLGRWQPPSSDEPIGHSFLFDRQLIKNKLGVEVEFWPLERLTSEMERIPDSEAEAEADKWIKGATEIREVFREGECDRKYIVREARLYLAYKGLIEKLGVTAFAGCGYPPDAPEPCISYIKLKGEGIPCGCEGDLQATLTMMMLMYLSGKPADMGNPLIPIGEGNMEDAQIPDPGENTFVMVHMDTPLNMDGIGTPEGKYIFCGVHCSRPSCQTPVTYTELRRGQDVTVARLGPNAQKMLVTEGKIVETRITPQEGNREAVYIKVRDVVDWWQKAAYVGHHWVYVYGKYEKELSELCQSLGIEVLTI